MPGRLKAPGPGLHCRVRAAFALLLSSLACSRLLRPRLRGARAARQERAAFAAILGQPSPGVCGQRADRPLSCRGVARRAEGPNSSGSFQNGEARLSLAGQGVSASQERETAFPRGCENTRRSPSAKGVEGWGNNTCLR